MVNRTGPKAANANATIVHGMGQCIAVVDAHKLARIFAQTFTPGKNHPEKRH